jgi:hypothetical protein
MRPNPLPLNLNMVSPRGLMWIVIVLLAAVCRCYLRLQNRCRFQSVNGNGHKDCIKTA